MCHLSQSFLVCASKEAQRVYQSWTIPDEEKEQYDPLIQRSKDFCKQGENETFCRYLFTTWSQNEQEAFNEFRTAVRSLAKDSGFGGLEESIIRDRIICGIKSTDVRERLLREPRLDLTRAVEIGQAAKTNSQQLQQMTSKTP